MNGILSHSLSFVLGIMASLLVWWITVRVLKPKIRINEIYKESSELLTTKFTRVKITNCGLFDAYDVVIIGRIHFKSQSKHTKIMDRTLVINVGEGTSPYIAGRGLFRKKRPGANTRWYALTIPQATLKSVQGIVNEFGDNAPIKSVEDILYYIPDSFLRITITASHNFSGSRSMICKDFTYSDFATKTRELCISSSCEQIKNTQYAEKPNEDKLLTDDKNGIFILFDGVSRDDYRKGCSDNILTSQVTETIVSTIYSYLLSHKKSATSPDFLLREAHYVANQTLAKNKASYSSFLPGAVGVVCLIRNDRLHYSYIGDCTGLVIREGRKPKEFTNKQTQDLQRYNDWHEQLYDSRLSKEYIRNEICNNIHSPYGYGVINGDPRALDFVKISSTYIYPEDIIVLCSDGFDRFMKDTCLSSISEVIRNSAVKELAEKAFQANQETYHTSDDISIIKIEVK